MNFTYDEGYVHSIEHSRKQVTTEAGDELRDLATLRVRFNRPIPKDDGWGDKGGFWANVEVWGHRATHLECIRQGAIVGVAGNLVLNEWSDSETGEERSSLVLKARSVTLVPACIESVTFKRKSEPEDDDEINETAEPDSLDLAEATAS